MFKRWIWEGPALKCWEYGYAPRSPDHSRRRELTYVKISFFKFGSPRPFLAGINPPTHSQPGALDQTDHIENGHRLCLCVGNKKQPVREQLAISWTPGRTIRPLPLPLLKHSNVHTPGRVVFLTPSLNGLQPTRHKPCAAVKRSPQGWPANFARNDCPDQRRAHVRVCSICFGTRFLPTTKGLPFAGCTTRLIRIQRLPDQILIRVEQLNVSASTQ